MMIEHKRPKGKKGTVTTSFNLDEGVVELIGKWTYITKMSRNDVLNATSVWVLLKEGTLASDLSLKSLKTLLRFVERLGLECVSLEYRALLEILVRLRGLAEKGELSPEDPLLARVTERLRGMEPFTAYTPSKSPSDLERVEGEVAGELQKEYPSLEKLLAS